MANLAAVSYRQGSLGEAESLYRRALGICERVRGPDDREMAAILLDYAWVLHQSGRKPEGKRLESRARTILAMHPGDSGRPSVDVSELLSPQGKVR